MRVSEFEIIQYIREITEVSGIPREVIIPNGDDCFVFGFNGKALATTDTMVDGIHFLSERFSPYDIGVKSAISNLSDIASMGGNPLYALISLIVPPSTELEVILDIYRGLVDTFSNYGVYIGGGNISKGRDLTITVTLFGNCSDVPLTRSGAKKGDLIFVSGFVGDSSLGLEILLKKGKGPYLSEVESYLVSKHISPTPRIELGKRLVGIATSCIDISDGLLQDIEHILNSSGVGAKISLEKVPISSEYSVYISREKRYSSLVGFFKYPLSGGEDYELVFTVPYNLKEKVLNISKELNVKLTEIGEITENPGKLELFYFEERIDEKEYKGWKHF
ncbi:MAG: thiamine-phosphate kinase [Brevinematia bacterium]